MNSLVKELIRPLLEDNQKITAVYGGGFKPPIKGHFGLVQKALKDLPEIDDFIIYVGGGVRDGITQEQSMAIWGVYQEVLGPKVQIEPSAQPIRDVIRYAKNHPDEKVYFVIGYREGREDDLQDIASRTKGVEEKYPNLEVKVIKTSDPEVSGTNARKALQKGDKEKFFTFLPDEVPANEKEQIYNIVTKAIVREHMAHSNTTDIIAKCAALTNHMRQKGYNIDPSPSLKIIDSDVDNSQDFFGKTAYYDPNEQLIVLYTQGRHPKDIVRSYAHEMIHHIQNVEDRLGNITTTNTTEDGHLEGLEREAYEEGNIAFRNWTDSLQEKKNRYPFGLNEGLYDDTKNFDLVKQNPFDIKKLADKGIVFITKPGDGKGGVTDPNWEGDASVLTLYNIDKAEPWMEVAVKNLMPQAIPYIQKDQDKLIYNGKYRQILWGIDKKGLNPKDFYLQENKNKDPFGLNQYARELAQGLEEEEKVEKPKKYTIFCDMDGVLVDFDEGYKQLTGMSTHHADAQGKKEFWKAFRQSLIDKDISEESYWANLDWQPGGKELWDYISKYKPYVLTAPAVNFDLPDDQRYSQEYNESMKGKLNWVQRLPNMRKIYFAAAKNKPKFARPNHILIDDRQDTIDSWNANGGIGILYKSAQQVIEDLKELGL